MPKEANPVANEKNPKDRMGRGPRKVRDEKHKGSIPRTPARQAGMGRTKRVSTSGRGK
jgi:hypothetical protein